MFIVHAMDRKITGAFYAIIGVILCVAGFKTLLPAVLMKSEDLERVEFSVSLAWPGLLMIIFLIAYINMLGKNFFFNA